MVEGGGRASLPQRLIHGVFHFDLSDVCCESEEIPVYCFNHHVQ